MTKKNEVATTDQLWEDNVPAHLQGQEDTVGRGSEGVGAEDLTIPRIQIIQDLSPQHKKTKAEYIEGAEVGMAFNSATKALMHSPFYFVPVLFRKEYVIWKDRDSGGGFKGAFPLMNEAKDHLRTLENQTLMDIVDTGQHFCLIISPETGLGEEAVVSMSKSQMKVSRNLNTVARLAGGDRFSRVYKMEVVEDKSEKGEFYNWKITQLGYAPEPLYRQAEEMYNAIKAGERDVSREDDAPSGETDSGLSDDDLDNM